MSTRGQASEPHPGGTAIPPPLAAAGTFPLLDTLRAVGALCVVTTHVGFWAGDYTRHGTFGTVLARLDVGVAIFFVLSGFLLSRNWLQAAADHRPAPTLRKYAWKRFLRIAPVYVVAVVCALTFIRANQSFGLDHWLTTLFMIDAYSDDGFPAGLTHMWSLAVEVAFYIALPLLMVVLLGRRRRLDDRRVLISLAAMTLTSVWWHLSGAALVQGGRPREWLPAYLTWFAGGILLALVEVRMARGDRGRLGRALVALAHQPGSCWAMAAGLLLLAATPLAGPSMLAPPTDAQALAKHLLYAAIGFLVVLTGVFNDPHSSYSRVLGRSAGRRLGWISYGVFAFHLPILHLVMWATGWSLFDGRGPAIWAIAVVLSLAAAELSYRLVERPTLRLKTLVGRGDRPSRAVETTSPTIGTSRT